MKDICSICSGTSTPMTRGVRSVDHSKRISVCADCRKSIDGSIDDLIESGETGPFVVHNKQPLAVKMERSDKNRRSDEN